MISSNRSTIGYGSAILLGAIALVAFLAQWWNPLVAVNGFIPHGHCYLWKPGLVWLHVISDSLIAIAYVAISITLTYLVYRTRQDIPFHWMFLAFGSFIIACASTHFMDVWTLWHPTYWLSGFLKVLTAIASVTTAILLPTLVPKALELVDLARISEEQRSHLETTNRTLEAVNQQLKELNRLKTQFFTNVSHELRTPLALILGPVEKLLQSDRLSPEHQIQLELVNRNARLLLKQVNDLLDVSKLEANRMTATYTQVDLAHLVRLMAANFDGLAQEKQITFAMETPASLPAQVDVAKTQRICLNLLSNAFKFTPPGGTIRCVVETCASPTQNDGETATPEYIRLAVQDSGPGVPLMLRESVFERFSQGEGGTTRRFGGTGLGLAIAREFAELQGGTIAVDEAPEGGARFVVTLPRMAPPTIKVASMASLEPSHDIAELLVEELKVIHPTLEPTPTHSTDKPLVLVVEDNPEMNLFITTTLAPDYRTATAANGQEGLEQAIALQPDLILSDVMMPQLSGDQFVQQVRTHPELDTIPIVMLTARADQDLRIHLLRQGAQDYLMKPFSVEELRARAGNLITLKRVRDGLQAELASQSHDLDALVEEVSLRRRELQIALNTLQAQAEELEQANRLKEEFLAIVSHELRTPLNSILGWSQALRTRQFDPLTTERALETIERNARLQTGLIENLLDISRLLRGRLHLKKRSVEMRSVVEAAVETLQSSFTSKGIHLECQLPDTTGPVMGDRDRLQQIIEQLLSNAAKFTPAGGTVEIQLSQQDEMVTVQVRDNGQGIPPEALPYIFDCFRQADSSTTRQHGGLGLGLAIAHHLVELHGGEIQAESPGEGRGSTFTVTLPLMVSTAPPLFLH